ncbi:MAG: hypothetical protein EOP45_00275 [Sphingobacteriaceae bacterium]|nr:MAG: hypothetical protein EOP45_00275 [Sphingobacteriaceae bacterium]
MLLIYIIYTQFNNPDKVKGWIKDFKHGYLANGLPKWWENFAKSYFGKFIFFGGIISMLMVRNIIPTYLDSSFPTEHNMLYLLLNISMTGFYLQVFTLSVLKIYSSVTYVLSGKIFSRSSNEKNNTTVRAATPQNTPQPSLKGLTLSGGELQKAVQDMKK